MLEFGFRPSGFSGTSFSSQTLLQSTGEDFEAGTIKSARGGRQLGDHLIAISASLDHGDHASQLPVSSPQAAKYLCRILVSDFQLRCPP